MKIVEYRDWTQKQRDLAQKIWVKHLDKFCPVVRPKEYGCKGIPKLNNRYYSSCGRISSIHRGDTVDAVEFYDGHDWWVFQSDAGDWEVGDSASVIFEDIGKRGYIYDDRIVYARYTPQDIREEW